MNTNLLTQCKNLLLISTLLLSSSVFSAANEHPSFRLKPEGSLDDLQLKSASQVSISRLDKKPSQNELHYDEKHPRTYASIADTSSIDPRKLMISDVISIDPEKPNLKLPDPVITIKGKDYILSVIESVFDHKENFRYVTALIVGHEGNARFIIDDATKEVVGNITIDSETYRVLPREINNTQQIIYKLKSPRIKSTKRLKARIISKDDQSNISRLERELLKTELLLDIKPKIFRQSSNKNGGRTKLIRGNIGNIDVNELITKRNVAPIKTLLDELQILTYSDIGSEYQISKIVGTPERGYSVNYNQIINGIPLRSGSRIRFTDTGQVTELSNMMIGADRVDIKPSMYSETEILQIAKKAAQKHLSENLLTFITLERTPPSVGYKIIDANNTLTPYWEILLYEVQSEKGAYRVFVDGHTGKAKVREALDRITTQIQTDICEHESGISLPACQDVNIVIPFYPPITIISTVREIISESTTGQFICEYSGLCQDPQAKHPWEVINNMEDWLSENTDGICCSEVGGLSDSIDVKINTPDPAGPSFDKSSGTISIPHPASLDPSIYNPVQAQKIDDVVVHEATHGVIHGVNSELSSAISGGDPWATALNEGFADAMAVLYSETFSPPGNTKIAEELFKNSNDVRDISDSKSFDDFIDSSAPGIAQSNGKIFSNMIYRLRQNGLSISQAAKVIVWIADTVSPDDGLIHDKLDEKDIKDAIDDISVLDQAIGAILDIVWGQMNGYEDPPAGGGGSGTPFSPSFVTGVFNGCYNNSVSLYSNSWGASSGASYYQVYYSPTGGGYTYSFSSSFPAAGTANTINAFVKVKACNSNGCSPLSNSTFFQPHLCGG
jgi:hypothetical protein